MKQNKKMLQMVRGLSRRSKYTLFILWSVACISVGYGVHTAVQPMGQMPGGMSETYVLTGKPTVKDMRSYQSFIAFAEPINEVNLKPQVSGTVEEVLFKNGSYVKEGDVLFVIDKRKYEANVQSAQADLDKAHANVVQIKNDYNRQLKLYQDKFLPKAELEVAESNLAQANAAVQQADANLKLAQLDLEHATVVAPISGYISKALVTKGNYVDTNGTTLARIVQTNPIRISFSVTDKERLEGLKMHNGNVGLTEMNLILSDGRSVDIMPTTLFADSETSTDTATLSVYIEYDNAEKLLLPGNIFTLRIPNTEKKNAVTVPQSAVLQDANGKYVMKTNPSGIAVQQYIETSETIDNYAVIDKGLSANDTVILSGGQKVSTGQKVKSISADNQEQEATAKPTDNPDVSAEKQINVESVQDKSAQTD